MTLRPSRKADDLVEGLAVVLDDLAGLAGGRVLDGDDLLAGAGRADLGGVEAEVGDRQLVDRLGLGRHDPLEGGVAGLDHAGGDGHDGRHRAGDLVVAGLGLALDLDLVALDVDLLGEGDRREAEEGGDLLGDGARVAVARLGGGEHQVGLGPLDGGGQHLGGVEGTGAREGVVGDRGWPWRHPWRGRCGGRPSRCWGPWTRG